LQQQQQSQQ